MPHTLPLALRLRGKSTQMSHRAPIYYVDLTLREDCTLEEAIGAARAVWDARQAAGVNQAALDDAARTGFALGEFEETEEDGAAVVEEFYPQEDVERVAPELASGMGLDLAQKIRHKAKRLEVRGA